MVIGTCIFKLRIPMATSLKEKRRVLKSFITRARNKYNISISEIGDNDVWQRAEVGIATIANSRKYVDRLISSIVDFAEDFNGFDVTDYTVEII
ncbi:DUF503 domain-containing protein [Halothermothrix orenii]|uniref:Uncharacterized protein conserved in bacteria n=1 Tax=Halothermothrix orenii (strain H 168 / OCM 544 / DSM 9562) TaxID=373903 RepID=B8CYD9_HALOH|nr:DUF503 domain-containing protein [Halothermothrix orenii]ACL70308.1 uncharacterized protein conserved in bacteria [Halothermothrix orenii H 168]